jgi:penicillin amidase
MVLAVFALSSLVLFVHLRRSLPAIEGEVIVAGLSAPVEIVRDADLVPHIFGANRLDALFGLGYAHAQDRLWQMEFQRRIGHGRLSEIFGRATVPQDRFLRTVGFGRAARAAWERLPADARAAIDAYVAGVNAFIATGSLPPEFTVLWFSPEPWTGADVLVWVKMMAWDLSANYSFELMRHDLMARVGEERMAQLLPPYPAHGLSIVPSQRPPADGAGASAPAVPRPALPAAAAARAGPPATAPGVLGHAFTAALSNGDPRVRDVLLGGARTEALGSNNWVIDGTLSATGRPLLANDPHLGTNIPSTWYLAHMSAGPFDVIGATLPGAPAVAIGRNRHIAWGETNVAADVEDLYLERLDPTRTSAEFRGGWEPLRTLSETIAVKGSEPVQIQVRLTRHGPLVSDAINAINADSEDKPAPLPPIAFRWTALDDEDTTVLAFLKLNEARNWEDFTAALRDFVVPSQNFVYADVDGNIGYYAPGRIPIRASGEGSRPAEGWSGAMEWIGYIPFEDLPHRFNPPEHFIVTANHRPTPADYPHLIALEYPDPYRAQRVIDMIEARAGTANERGKGPTGRLSVEDFRDIQADTRSLHAKALLPLLLTGVHSGDSRVTEAVRLLRAWDFEARADSAASAVFQAWFHQLPVALAADELGPRVFDEYNGRFTYITRFVTNTLLGAHRAWCDDVTTAGTESCENTITRALSNALSELENRLGTDRARWRWDAIHPAVFPHQGLATVPGLGSLLSRSIPSQGDWSTVNVGPVDADAAFEQRSVPGYRHIVDLSPANDSRFLDAVGQSGHFLSPQYDDFLADWRAVRHRRMRMERADIERDARGTVTLMPGR